MAYVEVKTSTSHANCSVGFNWFRDQYGYWDSLPTRVGEVRRCHHGRVQVCYQIDCRTSRRVDLATPLWRTLSPFWHRKLYKQALIALEASQ